MSNIIRVVSAAVSQTGAVFYTDEGEERTIPVTDPRITAMVDQVIAAVNAGKIPVMVDLTTYSVFTKIEEESGGLMKFFRVAKNKLSSLLGHRADRGPVNGDGFVKAKSEAPVQVQPGTEDVTPEIVTSLEAAHKDAENKALSTEDTTVVAVIGKTPIVGAEALEGHAKAAVASGETIGFRKMMERLGAVAKLRKHTVQEALAFLKEMDLPFANDGSIIAYKSLSQTRDDPNIFIDNHSKTLKQGLGTLVQMDVELVDDNRRVECSNGLHVARRGYLSGYGTGNGHVVCLIKIAPEDVISVPMNERSKMRVRAYHIVAVLSNDDMNKISQQKSFTLENMDQASLLAKVIRGEHIGITNVTTQHKGRSVDQMVPVQNINAPQIIGKDVKEAHTIDVVNSGETAVNPLELKAINEKVAEPAKKKPEAADGSEAFILYNLWKANKTQAAWDALMDYRKKITFFKGWPSLGLTQGQTDEIKAEIERQKKASKKAPNPETQKAIEDSREGKTIRVSSGSKKKEVPKVKPGEVQKILKAGAKKAATNAKAAAEQDKKNKPAPVNKVRVAYEAWKRNPTDQMAEVLKVAKKAAKKGWDSLGFSPAEIDLIKKELGLK